MGLKKFAIESLEIAQWNVLKAIFRLQPEDFEAEIKTNFNPINWILGHLMIQMDYYFNYLCQGKRIVSEAFLQFYHPPRVDHEEITDFPLSIKDLIDTFLVVSESSFNYLNNLPEEKFNELPENNENNTDTSHGIGAFDNGGMLCQLSPRPGRRQQREQSNRGYRAA